jgi:single-strand DNA-binding protein
VSNINTVALSGNLTRDPELRHTPSGFAIAKLGIAVNKSKKNPDGDGYIEEGHFFDVDVLGNFGELCARKLRKGDRISVQGELEYQSWESEGGKRSKVSVLARSIDASAFFKKDEEIGPRQDGAAGEGQQSMAAATASDDDIPF